MFGICIAALGYNLYGSYALNLAISLKIAEPEIKIALLCDNQAISHLSDEEKRYFDYIIYVEDFKSQGYQVIKLLINKYTPFEYTMYMDVDSIWLDKKPSDLFKQVFGSDFKIGMAGEYVTSKDKRPKNNYTFWGVPKTIINYHSLTNNIPQTVSGFYYFKKCDFVDRIFSEALKVYFDPKAPTIKWANGKPDEYCLNVALSKLGYSQNEFSVFYFDKMDGRMRLEDIYNEFWGIALGGNKNKKDIAIIYNKLVDRNCTIESLENRHYCRDKKDLITERLKN